MSAASRPITQQGLSGLKAPQSSRGGINRIYNDQRYWVSLIQAQMNKINEEMARLRKENEECKMKTLNIASLRKTAKNLAKTIEEQQEQMNVYNTALEMHISKTKEEEIVAETERIKRDNEIKYRELDNLFNEQLKMQKRLEKARRELEEVERMRSEMIEKLSDDDKEKYWAAVRENEAIEANIEKMQGELDGYKKKIEHYKEIVAQSKEKQEEFQLLLTLQRLENQKEELQNYLRNTLTPAQQREMLLEQVKKDKADTEALTKIKDTLEKEVEAKKERLAELERELDGQDNARLKKHKELRERGQHMEAFIATFEEKRQALVEKLEAQCAINEKALEYMSNNITNLDLEEFGDVDVDVADDSLESWNKVVSVLSSQIDKLKSYITRCEAEISSNKRKQETLSGEIADMKDVDKKKKEMEAKRTKLVEEEAALKAKFESTEAAVVEIEKRIDEITQKLEDNPSYHEVLDVEKKIEEMESRNRDLEEQLKLELNSNVLDDLNARVQDLLTRRNEQLIEKLRKVKK